MTNTTAILNHLQASEILEVRTDWAYVLWVKAIVSGRVICRFVSKKIGVPKMISRSELAKKIAAFYNNANNANNDLSASVWDKGDKVRVYVKDMGYRNSSAQDQGFIEIKKDGSLSDCLKNNSSARRRWEWSQWENENVIPYSAHAPRLSLTEVATAASQRGKRVDDTTKALNAMYGRGGWDRWDREDYEG